MCFITQSEFIQRKSLCQLIYKKLKNVATITSNQYEQALKKVVSKDTIILRYC